MDSSNWKRPRWTFNGKSQRMVPIREESWGGGESDVDKSRRPTTKPQNGSVMTGSFWTDKRRRRWRWRRQRRRRRRAPELLWSQRQVLHLLQHRLELKNHKTEKNEKTVFLGLTWFCKLFSSQSIWSLGKCCMHHITASRYNLNLGMNEIFDLNAHFLAQSLQLNIATNSAGVPDVLLVCIWIVKV